MTPTSRSRHGRARGRDTPGTGRLIGSGIALTWRADRHSFLVTATLQVVAALSPAALVLVGAYLISRFTASSRPDFAALVWPVLLFALASAVTSAVSGLQQQQQRLLGERVASFGWERLLDVTTTVPLEQFESDRFFDQLQRVRSTGISQPVSITQAVFGLLGGVTGVVSLAAVLIAVEPLLLPLLLAAGIPSVLLSRLVRRSEFAFLVRATPLFRAREYLRETLSGRDEAKEIRVFAAERTLRRRHTERRVAYDRLLSDQVVRRRRYAFLDSLTSSVFLALSLLLLASFVASGRLNIAQAGAAVIAVRFLSGGLQQLFRSFSQLMESSAYLSDLRAFLDLEVASLDDHPAGGPGIGSGVRLAGVDFSYPDSPARVLSGVDLSIGPGQVVAVVGENGSGKTTLAKLVAGLYRPDRGTVTWDGVDVQQLGPAAVRRNIAVIFQDFVRYQLTATENIGLGDPDAVDDVDRAVEAARRAGADGYLSRLPRGYDTVLSREFEGGQDLSGGQWQRVALARALRKDAELVVLDEPSAALDPRAEASLFADIRRMLDGRAALLISHRFSSVRLADAIYVLRDGHVVEHGTHEQLMADRGLYAELFSLQAAAYLDDGGTLASAPRPDHPSAPGETRREEPWAR